MQEVAQDFTPTVVMARDLAPVKGGAPYLLRWIAAICFVSVIAGGAFAQIQVLLLRGYVPVTPAIFKALLLLVLGIAFFARGARCVVSLQVTLGVLLLLGLGISTVHILFSSHIPLNDLLLSDFLLYFVLLLGCSVAALSLIHI